MPRFWTRAYDAVRSGKGAPKFPQWNKGSIAYPYEMTKDPATKGLPHYAASGVGSVHLPVSGGSCRLLLEPGVIPVLPGADYKVAAKVRTQGLVHAGARLGVRLLDARGNMVSGSERHCEATQAEGSWREVATEIVGDFPDAAFMQIHLDVLQPELFESATLGKFQTWPEDLNGHAWFDDVVVTQLPRVELTTDAPMNVVTLPDRPTIRLSVRDMTGEALTARLRLHDAAGTLIDEVSQAVGATDRKQEWSPRIEKLGWYRADMSVVSGGKVVGVRTLDFLWLPGDAAVWASSGPDGSWSSRTRSGSTDRARFGLIALDLPASQFAQVSALPGRIGTGALTVPVWTDEMDQPRLGRLQKDLAPLMDSLLEQWQDVTLALSRVPKGLASASKGEIDDVWSVVRGDDTAWADSLEPILDRYGQRVRRVMVGQVGDDRAFWSGSVASDMEKLSAFLRRSVAGPVVGVPVRLDQGSWAGVVAGPGAFGSKAEWIAFAPATVLPSAVGEAVGTWAGPAGSTNGAGAGSALTIAFAPAREQDFGPRAAAGEFAKRVVEAWAASTETRLARVALVQPWTFDGLRRPGASPKPELAAMRTLVDRLGDRRVIGTFPTPEGTVCYVLGPAPGAAPGRGGALVAWNDWAAPEDARLVSYLGSGELTLVDIFGNTSRPSPAPRAVGSKRETGVEITLTNEPVFVEGIDVALVRFLASFRVEPPFIESTKSEHEHTIDFENTWGTGLNGAVTIVEPGRADSGADRPGRDWRISPRVSRFAVASGEGAELPFSVTVGSGADGRGRDFVFEAQLSAGESYPPIEIRRHMDVGLSTIKVDLTRSRQNESDVVVEAAITNIGKQAVDLSLTAFAPGQPRSLASINALPPGTQIVRRFTYPDAAAALKGKQVTVSVVETEANARLNSTITIE